MGEITGNGTAVTGLGGSAGFGETELPRGDDTVARVDVSTVFGSGFNIGGVHYSGSDLYISTDGLISFGGAVSGVVGDPAAVTLPFFAIFNGDVDLAGHMYWAALHGPIMLHMSGMLPPQFDAMRLAEALVAALDKSMPFSTAKT